MSFNWSDNNPGEYQDEEEELAAAAQAVLTGGEEPVAIQDDDFDAQMGEAEQRFEQATYYRLLLRDTFFVDDPSETAQIVETEIRGFVKSRLAELLGVTAKRPAPIPVVLPFSENQIVALQQLADSILNRPKLLKQIQPSLPTPPKAKPAPTLRKVEAAQPAPVHAPQAPQLRRKPGPKPAPAKAQVGTPEINPETGLAKQKTVRAVNPDTGKEYDKVVSQQVKPANGTPGYKPVQPVGKGELDQEMANWAMGESSRAGAGGLSAMLINDAMKGN